MGVSQRVFTVGAVNGGSGGEPATVQAHLLPDIATNATPNAQPPKTSRTVRTSCSIYRETALYFRIPSALVSDWWRDRKGVLSIVPRARRNRKG